MSTVFMKMDGLEEAFIGLANQFTKPMGLAYSKQKILDILMKRDDMTYEEAYEYFEFNIEGSWVGEGTPIIIDDTISLEDTEEWIDSSL